MEITDTSHLPGAAKQQELGSIIYGGEAEVEGEAAEVGEVAEVAVAGDVAEAEAAAGKMPPGGTTGIWLPSKQVRPGFGGNGSKHQLVTVITGLSSSVMVHTAPGSDGRRP